MTATEASSLLARIGTNHESADAPLLDSIRSRVARGVELTARQERALREILGRVEKLAEVCR